jgi:hypothetical protein
LLQEATSQKVAIAKGAIAKRVRFERVICTASLIG